MLHKAFYKRKVIFIIIRTLRHISLHSNKHSLEPVARWCVKGTKSRGIYLEILILSLLK